MAAEFLSELRFSWNSLIHFSDGKSRNGFKEEDVALEDEEEEENYCKLPKWLYKYLVFRFNLLDRLQDILTPDFSTPSFNSGLLIPGSQNFFTYPFGASIVWI